MKKFLSSIVMLGLLASCATQTFLVNPNVKREVPSSNPHFSEWNHFFLQGIGQSAFKNANNACKDNGGLAFVEAKQSTGQVFVAFFTLGIYTPRTMNIYCNSK